MGILIFILHNILIILALIKLQIMTKNELLLFCHYVNFLFQNGDNYPDTKIILTICRYIHEREMVKYFFQRIFPFPVLLVTNNSTRHLASVQITMLTLYLLYNSCKRVL